MLILLHLLEEALERCTSGQSDGAHVAGICLQLQVDIPKRFAQYTDPGMATADFARYHRGLVALYTCSLTTQNDTIIAAVGKLLNYHERLYHDLLDPAEPLPAFHAGTLKMSVYDALPALVQQLEAKKVPSPYLSELRHAMDTLFAEGKPPLLTYHHRTYLPQLIGMLKQLAGDRRQKDWSKRFVESLVNYNFNYMGFFNRWQKARDGELEAARKDGSTPALVSGWYDTLQHHTPIPDLAFVPRQPSLLEHMTLYVCAKASAVVEWKNREAQESSISATAIKTTLNSKMQALDLRYRSKRGYYDYPSMAEAAIAYSGSHLSKTGRNISPHTLQRFDTVELEDAVHGYLKDLSEMIKEIRRDFRL